MSTALLSRRVLSIAPSPSIAANALVATLRAQGRDIVNFTVGEPDLATPAHIVEAAQAAMLAGDTHYTNTLGTPALRKAIVTKLQRDNGLEYTVDQVVAAAGGKQIIFEALAATLDPEDEVIVHTPYWVSYPDITRLNGGTPVVVVGHEGNGFKLTPEELDAAINPQTKWLILNSPNNPSGAVYTLDELQALAEVLRKHPDVLVMADEIYEHFVYTEGGHVSFANAAPDLKERTLIVNGASKGYAMTGWRLGFGAGPTWLIAAIGKLLSQSTTCPSSISQAAAVAAFAGDQAPVRAMASLYKARRNLMLELLSAIPGLSCVIPDGAFYVFANVAGLLGRRVPQGWTLRTDADVVRYWLEEAGVATVVGDAYGLSPYVRLSFASGDALIREGCARLHKACAVLR
ncbi:pyridoxal phosphate-dependent aminotransferase [Pseudomonas gingeri]|uniref:Aminotransferase n=1 Tax=Pseudomonas gingeri TaxID=117681 RepID=A0A7Y7YEJ6_9PSED|nr:pyridoxal phosphate-dependent aminotransferase [Pseudomonas gingeri]NWA03290.1 pyridoxal phosphate-dependent aminotransferase [Pseudomonas gingeri]NWA14147.1 pyridoxal phosphate-dependent aminotransferase [Pseudomonas gingeri]NWA55235.1 pyridoxal phosphate-dependent aminotransferase [Pseudomonas gingeri]NWA94959.1 pyridoxal phosphate-dependent aminotransferase [Pseudomonas gingeri]NWB01615.1 pyridoxal phosphate-dependent aminotransferase [Pseudomonas gingeri]